MSLNMMSLGNNRLGVAFESQQTVVATCLVIKDIRFLVEVIQKGSISSRWELTSSSEELNASRAWRFISSIMYTPPTGWSLIQRWAYMSTADVKKMDSRFKSQSPSWYGCWLTKRAVGNIRGSEDEVESWKTFVCDVRLLNKVRLHSGMIHEWPTGEQSNTVSWGGKDTTSQSTEAGILANTTVRFLLSTRPWVGEIFFIEFRFPDLIYLYLNVFALSTGGYVKPSRRCNRARKTVSDANERMLAST